MRRRLLAALLLLPGLALGASCTTFAVAAATVNGEKITEATVESELDRVRDDPTFQDLLRRQADEFRGVARRNILTGLIRQTILDQEARRLSIRVTQAQVDRLIAEEAGRQGLSVDEFRRLQNLSVDDAREIGERIVRLFELRSAVTEEARVPADRVRTVYEAQREAFAEVHLLRITVRSEADARRVLEELQQGGSFERAAREHSIDDLAAEGGDMGYVPLGALNSLVQAALEQTSTGAVSDPVPTEAGVEIYRLQDRRPRAFSDVEDEITSALIDQAREEQFEQWMAERLRAARIVVNPKYGRFDAQAMQIVPGDPDPDP